MSIGKSSIARAVNATAKANVQTTTNPACRITNFLLDNIATLSIAKTPDDINNLKQSISKRGVICPLLVAVTPKGDAWLVDGYRRLTAARELGITQINAIVINVETKRDANNLYNELSKPKPTVAEPAAEDIHEEKFRVIAIKDRDLPTYLL